MAFASQAVNVMLCGPGDVVEALTWVEDEIHSWNSRRAAQSSVVLIPRHWSRDAISSFGLGSDGQAEINSQLVEKADIVFALFHSRIGTETPRAASGSAEEVEKAINRGLRLHVFFSTADTMLDRDQAQYEALKALKDSLRSKGLYTEFTQEDALRAAVRRTLDADCERLQGDNLATHDRTSIRGPFVIISRACGLALDTGRQNDSEALPILWRPHGYSHQLWGLRSSDVRDELFIQSESNGLAFDCNPFTDAGHPCMYQWNGEPWQRWSLEPTPDRVGFCIKSLHTGDYLNADRHFTEYEAPMPYFCQRNLKWSQQWLLCPKFGEQVLIT
jgi:hypothetical protein